MPSGAAAPDQDGGRDDPPQQMPGPALSEGPYSPQRVLRAGMLEDLLEHAEALVRAVHTDDTAAMLAAFRAAERDVTRAGLVEDAAQDDDTRRVLRGAAALAVLLAAAVNPDDDLITSTAWVRDPAGYRIYREAGESHLAACIDVAEYLGLYPDFPVTPCPPTPERRLRLVRSDEQ